MVNNGANPYVVSYNGRSQFDHYHLENLSNLPTKQSIYYTTRPVIDEFKDKAGFRDPWFYRTGIFDGKFNAVIERGASGIVFSGKWCGKHAAFKFVEFKAREFEFAADSVRSLDKLSEMKAMQVTKGSKVLSFYGHYRYVNLFKQ